MLIGKLIVVYGLLHLFVFDPHIDKADAKHIIKEISHSLRKISKDRFVIASFSHCNSEYEKMLLPVFDNMVEITNDVDSRTLQTRVYTRHLKRKAVSTGAPLRKVELTLVPSR
ncbi:hypothetical protein BH18THE2_BH18THE2_29460 [soil metagenome]